MRLAVYETRPDEKADLARIAEELGVELMITHEVPTVNNLSLAQGCAGISMLGQGTIDRAYLDRMKELGIGYLSTRTIGYNHIDTSYAKELGIRVCNARYEPNGVADFTVMMMLMSLRHYKQALWRGQVNDFSLNGLQGRQMKDLTVGIIGTGKIGAQVLRNLTGFGCRLMACDQYRKEDIAQIAEYTDLETIFRECDMISVHTPLTDANYHMIDRAAIAKMKDGVILINCARGELMDIDALVDGIESQKIGALAMDTVEGDTGIIHEDHRTDILANRSWFYLHQFRNVIMTPHMAFYTDAAVASMAECGIRGIVQMASGEHCPTEL